MQKSALLTKRSSRTKCKATSIVYRYGKREIDRAQLRFNAANATKPKINDNSRRAQGDSVGMAAKVTVSVALAPGAVGAFADVRPSVVFG